MIQFKLEDGSYMNVTPENLDIFKQRYPNATEVGKTNGSAGVTPIGEPSGMGSSSASGSLGQYVPYNPTAVSDKIRHANTEKLVRENLLNFYSSLPGNTVPKWALPYVTNFWGGSAGLVSGVFKSVEGTYENFVGMSAEEQREDGTNPISEALDSFHDFPGFLYAKSESSLPSIHRQNCVSILLTLFIAFFLSLIILSPVILLSICRCNIRHCSMRIL